MPLVVILISNCYQFIFVTKRLIRYSHPSSYMDQKYGEHMIKLITFLMKKILLKKHIFIYFCKLLFYRCSGVGTGCRNEIDKLPLQDIINIKIIKGLPNYNIENQCRRKMHSKVYIFQYSS